MQVVKHIWYILGNVNEIQYWDPKKVTMQSITNWRKRLVDVQGSRNSILMGFLMMSAKWNLSSHYYLLLQLVKKNYMEKTQQFLTLYFIGTTPFKILVLRSIRHVTLIYIYLFLTERWCILTGKDFAERWCIFTGEYHYLFNNF